MFHFKIYYLGCKKKQESRQPDGSLLSCYSSVMQSLSSVTLRAIASFMAVDILQSSLRSMFSMVRTGTSARAESFGTERPCSRRILRRFIISFLSGKDLYCNQQEDSQSIDDYQNFISRSPA